MGIRGDDGKSVEYDEVLNAIRLTIAGAAGVLPGLVLGPAAATTGGVNVPWRVAAGTTTNRSGALFLPVAATDDFVSRMGFFGEGRTSDGGYRVQLRLTRRGGGSLSDNFVIPASQFAGGGVATTLLALTDTPAVWGTTGQVLAVNADADGAVWVDAASGGGTFLLLTDTPASFGTAGQIPAVNAAGNALEWATPATGGGATTLLGLTDTPGAYGTSGQVLAVNAARNALVFADAATGGNSIAFTIDGQNMLSGVIGSANTPVGSGRGGAPDY